METYFWNIVIQNDFMGAISRHLCSNEAKEKVRVAMWVMEELPLWDYIETHATDLAIDRQTDWLMSALVELLSALESTPNDYDRYCDLQKLWKMILSSRKYLLSINLLPEAESILKSLLRMLAQFLLHQSLEKQISAALVLDSFAKSDDRAELTETVLEWVRDFGIVGMMLADPHPQVLKRSVSFLKWLHEAGELPSDRVFALFKSAVGAHESYSECVFDLIAALSPGFSSTEIDRFSTEVLSIEQCFSDSHLLKFVRQFIEALPPDLDSTVSFAKKVLSSLLDIVYSDEAPAALFQIQTFVDILRMRNFRSVAFSIVTSVVRKYLSQRDNARVFPAEWLYNVLDGFKGDQDMIIRIVSEVQELKHTPLGVMLIVQIQTRIQHGMVDSHSREDMNWILKTMDLLACATYIEETRQCCISAREFVDIFTLLCMKGQGEMREDFLNFLEACSRSSVWCRNEILLICFEKIGNVEAKEFVKEASMEQFEVLWKLFLRMNSHAIYSKNDAFVYVDRDKLFSFAELILYAILPRDEEIRQLVAYRLNKLLTMNKVSNKRIVDEFFYIVASHLQTSSEMSIKLACLTLLKEVIMYEQKYRTLLRHESELMDCVVEAIRDLKFDLNYGLEEVQEFLLSNFKEIAAKMQIQYMQVKFFPPKNQKGPLDLEYITTEYRPVSTGTLINREKVSTLLALNTSDFRVFEAALWILTNLIRSSKISKEIEALGPAYESIKSTGFEQRTLQLLALRELSSDAVFCQKYEPHAQDLLLLLGLLPREEEIKRGLVVSMRHLVLLYYEVLLNLIQIHFTNRGNPIPVEYVINAMDCLQIMSIYYSLPDTEKSYDTKLLSIAGDILNSSFVDPTAAERIANEIPFLDFCKLALTASESTEFSTSFGHFVLTICDSDRRFVKYFLDILLHFCDEAFNRPNQSENFFMVLGELLKRTGGDLSQFEAVMWMKSSIIGMLKESTGGLTGKLWTVCSCFLPLFTQEEISELVNEGLSRLFSLSEADPKLADSRSRKSSLCFIYDALLISPDLLQSVLTELGRFHSDLSWRKKKPEGWALSPALPSNMNFPGMKNPGAICYINSIFQQLFAIDSFANQILSVNVSDPGALLCDFQTILSQMRFKTSGVLSAERILFSLREQPIDPMEQTDIEEFLNEFMHVLESQLAKSQAKDVIQNHFKGVMIQTLTGKSPCTHTRSSPQPFLTMTLGIKAKRNLFESLSSLTRGELLTGLECPICQSKVPTESTHQIHHLPNVLVISLRRFDYNIETAQRFKINDYYEFPKEISLKDASIDQSFEADYYQYSLKGVIVHLGSAEAGHFYSLIKRNDKWMKFDDTIVQDFDEKLLGKEAFGGVKSKPVGKEKSQTNEKNAYLLIYTRAKFYEYRETACPPCAISLQASVVPEESFAPAVLSMREKSIHRRITRLKLRQLLTPEYSQFVTSLLSPSLRSIKTLIFSLSFFLTIHTRRRDWTADRSLFLSLVQGIRDEPGISFWMTEVMSFSGVLDEIILAAPIETKKAVVYLFKTMLETAAPSTTKRLLLRVTTKMEKLSNTVSKDVSQLFELMYYVVEKALEDAREIGLCERIVGRLLPGGESIQELVDKDPIYQDDGYLGYTLKQGEGVKLSEKTNIGFQLLVLNTLFPYSPRTKLFFLEHIGNMSVNVCQLFAHFERRQAKDLLDFSQADPSSFLHALQIAYYDKSKLQNELTLFSIMNPVLAGRNPHIAQRMLELLLEVRGRQGCAMECYPAWKLLMVATCNAIPSLATVTEPRTAALIRQRLLAFGETQYKIDDFLKSLPLRRCIKEQDETYDNSHYGEDFPEGTRVKVMSLPEEVCKGTVVASYSIFFIVKMMKTSEELWIPAESDLEFT